MTDLLTKFINTSLQQSVAIFQKNPYFLGDLMHARVHKYVPRERCSTDFDDEELMIFSALEQV